MPTPTPNAIDLTTLSAAMSWAGGGANDQQEIQDCITSFSAYVLKRCGLGPQDGSIPTESPLVALVTFSEVYDGNGSDRMFLRNTPINSISSLVVNNNVISASTQYGTPGYVIAGDKRSVYIRGGGGTGQSFTTTMFGAWCGGQRFVRGIQNVAITYAAGYDGVPFDLEMCARKVVALNYNRSEWIGQRSRALAQGAGTVSYVDWEMDKDCERVLNYYTRRAMV